MKAKHSGLMVWLVLIFLPLLIFSVWFYRFQESISLQQAQMQLDFIARFKVQQIVSWRESQIRDAQVLAADPFLSRQIEMYLNQGGDKSASYLPAMLTLLRNKNGLEDLWLVDGDGQVVISQQDEAVCSHYQKKLAEALRQGKPVWGELLRESEQSSPQISILVPVFKGSGVDAPLLACLVLIQEAEKFLYPLIRSWPLSSSSAETLLVRRDGHDALFLNDLRHQVDTALRRRVSLNDTSVPAVLGILGQSGFVRGNDYRGVRVASMVLPVPDSPWVMVAKMDEDELHATWNKQSRLILGLLASLIIGLGALVFLWWQRSMKQRYRELYQTEAVLRLEAQRHSIILKSIGDAVIATDVQGRVELLNHVAEVLTGWKEADAVGRPLADIFHIISEDTRERIADPVSRVLSSGKIIGLANHTLLLAADGREHLIADSGAPVFDEAGKTAGVVLVFRDQNEEREIEREREFSFTLLKAMGQSRTLKALITRVCQLMQELSGCEAVGLRYRDGDDFPYYETLGFSGEFVEAERYLCERDEAGQPVHDARGNPVLECMCGNVIQGRTNPDLPFFTANGSFWSNNTTRLLATTNEDERQARTRNRCNAEGYESVALIPLHYGEQILGLLQFNDKRCDCFTPRSIAFFERLASSIAMSLSQRLSEEDLRQSEAKYRALFDSAGDAIFTHDEGGRILAVNARACQIYGYSKAELIGMNIVQLDTPEQGIQIPERLNILMRDGSVRFMTDHRKKDGQILNIEVHARRMLWNGQPAIMSMGRDMTERRQAEAEREKLEEQLQQFQKMESVGRLAGGVAHDFNNMLGVILGHVEMAMDESSGGRSIQSDLREIQKAARRSADLTRQLLAFARKQTVVPKVLDLNNTIEGMLKLLHRLIGEDVELIWKPARNMWPVRMDPSQIDQILANLCVNARDAIDGVGQVTIETATINIRDAGWMDAVDFVPGDYVVLIVSDSGCGMDKETQSKLFEPFFTTKEVGKGTGLGLATVFGVVKQNCGHINVYSEPGQGTIFRIYLPRFYGDAEMTHADTAAAAHLGQGERVLLVEDEPAILRMTTQMLERMGYAVTPLSSPQEAIDYSRTHVGEVQLLMTDVIMPTMNGQELARHLQLIQPGLKVLFCSGYTADVIAHHGVLEEGVDFIQKPFTMEELATMMSKMTTRATLPTP